MKQRNQKHIALLSVVLVPALLLSACGSGASGQLSSSSTAPGSEPAVSVSQPEPEPAAPAGGMGGGMGGMY